MGELYVGVDFGKDGEIGVAWYDLEERTVGFYDSREAVDMLERLTLVNEGMTVVTTAPTMELTRFQLEFYYKLMYRKFGGPQGTAWVRKSRRKTRRF